MKSRISAPAVLVALLGVAACQEAGPLAPVVSAPTPSPDAVGHEAILPFHYEGTGRVVAFYTMANPAHQATILANCGVGAVAYVLQTGSGTATHLGRFQVESARCQYATGSWSVRATLTAANGDQIFASFIGSGGGIPDADGNYSVTVPLHATEGTGRFAHVVLDGSWTVGGNVNGSAWGVLDGTIQYDASDRAER